MTPAASADYPRTFKDFIERFDTEEACLAYVEQGDGSEAGGGGAQELSSRALDKPETIG
jgi:hypothetical protein